MRHVRIRTKVLVGFALAFAIAMAISAAAYVSARTVGGHLATISDSQFPLHRALTDVQEGVGDAHRFLGNLVLGPSSSVVFQSEACSGCHAEGGVFRDGAAAALEAVQKAVRQVDHLPHTPAIQRGWPQLRAAVEEWSAAGARLRTAVLERDRSALAERSTMLTGEVATQWIKVHQAGMPIEEALTKLLDGLRAEVQATHEAANAARDREGLVHTAMLVFAATLMALLAFVIGRSVDQGIETVVTQATRLSAAASEGRLDVRGDEAAAPSEFRPVIRVMNHTMEAIARPVRMATDSVVRISRGDLPSRITERYEGEFASIAEGVNAVIDVVNQRNADIRHLTESALAGRLSVRADTARYSGYNGKMVGGLNAMLDAAVAPVEEATQVLERLARRDLRARVKGEFHGDHARIKDALNATADALEAALSHVARASTQVSSAAGQIAASSQTLATGASQQAAAIEQTSSSLENMASMVKQSADSAAHANLLARSTCATAAEGASAMQQMTAAMQKIRTSAEGTSQIIKDINDIAFQTHLLGLNAAVEAARAGEAGRGFAVVAEEVRSLALRSKEAASKTEALILESVRQTGHGDGTARLVSSKLVEITSNASKVADLVGEIAASAQEQASGIDQVTEAVAQMNHVTQQNAAGAEQSSAAAAELSGESEELAAVVSSFQIDDAGLSTTAVP
jgi:methyl-accepting chemotaxis protein